MRAFSGAHRAVHFPPDRRFRIRIRSKEALVVGLVLMIPITIAWIQFLFFGLPSVSFSPPRIMPGEPHGFPAWIRLTHFVNFFFLMLLARSGLSILMDHPRLYWNRNCTPKNACGASRSGLDRERRRSLYLAISRSARLPPDDRDGSRLAFFEHLRLSPQRVYFYFTPVLHLAMETTRPYFVEYCSGRMERLRSLRNLPHAA